MKKTILLLIILMLGVISIANGATEPTCSFLIPSANTAYNGTINFSATIDSTGEGTFNITGMNFTVSSVVVGSSTEDGLNLSDYNSTVDTSAITDVKQTTVTANIIINSTDYYGSCTSTGVDFDNTNPVCSQSVDRDIIDALEPLTVDCSTSTDTTDVTYSIVLTKPDSTTVTKTPSDGKSVFDTSDTDGLGENTVACTVTDEVTKTNTCTSNTINIKGTGEDDITITPPPQTEKKSNVMIIVFVLVIILIVVMVIIFSTMKSGKKKR